MRVIAVCTLTNTPMGYMMRTKKGGHSIGTEMLLSLS